MQTLQSGTSMKKSGGKRYQLNLEDRNRLHSLLRLNFTSRTAFISGSLLILMLLAIGFMVGYGFAAKKGSRLGKENRTHLTDMVQRMDSLQQQAILNQAYIENLSHVLDIGRMPSDSTLSMRPIAPFPPESLYSAGEKERNFVNSMSSHQNRSDLVLASMAAEGVRFEPIALSGVQTQYSIGREEAEIVLPLNDPVLTPAEAKVIDFYYSSLEGSFTIILQHRQGFVSRLSGLERIIVNADSKLNVGDPVGFSPGRTNPYHRYIRLRLWHNGTALHPDDYIHQHENNNSQHD